MMDAAAAILASMFMAQTRPTLANTPAGRGPRLLEHHHHMAGLESCVKKTSGETGVERQVVGKFRKVAGIMAAQVENRPCVQLG